MTVLTNAANRTDLLNRLKRAEGQLRGIQRMLEEGQECMDRWRPCAKHWTAPTCA